MWIPKRRLLRFTDFPDLPVSFDGCADSFLVCCAKDTLIRANSEVWVPSSSEGTGWLPLYLRASRRRGISKKVFLGRTLTDGPPEAVLVANLGSKPRMFRKGSGLATCTKVATRIRYSLEISPFVPKLPVTVIDCRRTCLSATAVTVPTTVCFGFAG